LLNTSPHFLKIITNFYSNNASFCNGFLHNLHNHSSSFIPQELFEEQDLHWMFLPWLALQGLAFWLAWFCCVQDRSSRGLTPVWVKAMTEIGSHPDFDALDAPQVENGYDLVLWQQISTFHFLPYISNGQLSSLDDVCLLFSAIGCFWTSQYFLQNHIWLWYFSLFSNFWLPLHSHSVLHDYCSIQAALVQYQILLKEVMLNQKLFVIHE